MNTYLTFVHALSPLHAGTGQGVGVIDLPIAREKATGLPFLPGSSMKGTLRDSVADEDEQRRLFGTAEVRADGAAQNGAGGGQDGAMSGHAGSAQFSDQRLLLLPIRSLAGTFAWVTSPYLLDRFARDAAACGVAELPPIPEAPAENGVCFIIEAGTIAAGGSPVASALRCRVGAERPVVLEDLALTPRESPDARRWAAVIGAAVFPDEPRWQGLLAARLCIVHDDVLAFLLETATEVTARVALLPDTKTVRDGGLWYEEALPTETILTGLVAIQPPARAGRTVAQVLTALRERTGDVLQFGGKATVGRGLCRVRIAAAGRGV